jgi:hypothetical protein
MTVFATVAIVAGLVALLLFPWVGLALLPVVGLGVLAVVAWLVLVLTRGPRALPERRTPGEG